MSSELGLGGRGNKILPTGRSAALLLTIITLLALSVRLAVALATGTPTPDMLAYDQANYREAAIRLIEKGYFAYGSGPIGAAPNAYTVPGYSLFLAAIFSVFGHGVEGVQAVWLIQALVGALTVVLVYVLGVRVRGTTVGLLAAALLALYPPHFLGTYYLMNEVLFSFFLVVVALLSLRALEKRSVASMVVLGIAAGLSAFVRAEGALLILPVILALVIFRCVGPKRTAQLSLVGLASVVLILSPWWLRNYSIHERFIPFNTSTANPALAAAYWPNLLPEHATVWPTSVSADEIELNERWANEAHALNQRQLREDPYGFASRRLRMLAAATFNPERLPFIYLPSMTWWQIWFNRAVRVAQPIVLLAAVVTVVRHWKQHSVFILTAILALRLALYATVLPLPRYTAPSFTLLTVLAAVCAVEIWRRRRRLLGKQPTTPGQDFAV